MDGAYLTFIDASRPASTSDICDSSHPKPPRTKSNKQTQPQVTVAQLGQRRVETAWHPDVTLFPMVGQAAAAYQMEEIAAQVKLV